MRVQGSVKDSAFLGVRLADGLKLETSALGLRTKVWIFGTEATACLPLLSSVVACPNWQLPPTPIVSMPIPIVRP